MSFKPDDKMGCMKYELDGEERYNVCYNDGMITIAAKDDETITYANAKEAAEKTDRFCEFINREWLPPMYPQSGYESEFKKMATKVKSEVKIGGVKMIDKEWVASTGEITDGAHPEQVLTYADYILLRVFNRHFLDCIRDFNRTK